VIAVIVLVAVGCGRQVTFPKYAQNGGVQAGFMTVRFTVQGTLAFGTYDYIIVLNTTGNGMTPLPDVGAQDNYQAFSDAIIVSGNASGATDIVPIQYVANGTTLPPTVYPLTVPPQDIQFNSNSNGANTQFEVQFSRKIFSSLVATPTPSPTTSPSPGPTPTPSVSTTWLANCFVTQPGTTGGSESTYVPVDSLGQGGGTDNTYVFTPPLDTTITFDQTYNAEAQNGPSPSAVIESCEFQNTP
jgi:hypothetical protein